jgi:hypothetical protein
MAGASVGEAALSGPAEALTALAGRLRDEGSVISPFVAEPTGGEPALGLLAAAGPRAARAPSDYAFVVESVREGYLLHYGSPRVVRDADADLALLAGDYLYALGLERLSGLGDLEAVRELADLISLSAQVNGEGGSGAAPLWLSSIVAVAAGSSDEHDAAKLALRSGEADAAAALWAAASRRATESGISDALERAAESIDFEPTGSV